SDEEEAALSRILDEACRAAQRESATRSIGDDVGVGRLPRHGFAERRKRGGASSGDGRERSPSSFAVARLEDFGRAQRRDERRRQRRAAGFFAYRRERDQRQADAALFFGNAEA